MVTCRTLTDGGQAAVDVAREVAAFLDGARRSLELAVYDFDLSGESEEIVLSAVRKARDRGVGVRLVYNVNHPNPIPVPPPPTSVPEDVAAYPWRPSPSRAFRISCTTSSSSAMERRC